MELRRIGGLDVSVVGLGCNNFGSRCDEARTAEVVNAALESGITLFDTADIYGGGLSEEYLGRALGRRRDDVVIATKFGMQMGKDPARKGGSARWISRAVEDSLQRLGTDRIDLYQMHAPDPETPIEETLETLDRLVRQGKVREIGNSNFSGSQVEEADKTSASRAWARFASAQNHYNLLHREIEEDALPACGRVGLGMLPYFPLASGLLTGKYVGGALPEGTRLASAAPERRAWVMSDRNLGVVDRLSAFAAERGVALVELAIAWLAARPSVSSVIAGATTPDQVRANVAAADVVLSPDDLDAIDAITS